MERRGGTPTWHVVLAAMSMLVAPSLVLGATIDIPVAGRGLTLDARAGNPPHRTVAFRAVDAAIATPFVDPTLGASLLVFSSSAIGECRAEIALPAANWTAIGGDGPNRGWLYRDKTGAAQGIRKVRVRRGRISVKGRGDAFPCGLEADQQSVPVSVVLRLGDTRYCAAFGGVRRNRAGRFRGRDAAAPAACPETGDVTIATLNILHGLGCGSTFCRQEERVILAGQFIVDRGCPDVVAFQEVINVQNVFPSIVTAVQDHLLDICPFPYEVVYIPGNLLDDSLLLTRYPAVAAELRVLAGALAFRNVLYARIDHPAGPIDVFSTHLAASSDGATDPCGPGCPPECVAAGATNLRDCQAVQVARMVEELHDVDAPAFLVGDFNEVPGSFVYDQYVDRGWTDAYLGVGGPECDSGTGIGCTSGRDDSQIQSPALNVNERIDFIFVVPPGPTSLCSAALDSITDADGDGTATRLFAELPNPFAPMCGPLPDPVCWSSDHNGVQADLNCD